MWFSSPVPRFHPFLDQIHHVQISMEEELAGLEHGDLDARTLRSLQRDGYMARGSVPNPFLPRVHGDGTREALVI